jgi:hypothetical protein
MELFRNHGGSKTPKTEVPIESIKITMRFKKSLPNSWKILRQYESYKSKGQFDNKIIIDSNMYLRDGYTQYLIAKMLGLETVTVYTK